MPSKTQWQPSLRGHDYLLVRMLKVVTTKTPTAERAAELILAVTLTTYGRPMMPI